MRSLSARTVPAARLNASTKEEIYNGLKGRFATNEILTGKELCGLFGIDYEEIVRIRTSDQKSNLDYFINEILRIGEIKDRIIEGLKQLKNH